MNNPLTLKEMKIYLIWFDSMGAKSSSVFVQTPEISLLIDPGAAVMQPSYPLSSSEKEQLKLKALEAIGEYSLKATHVFISHYHYDHHILPSKLPSHIPDFYNQKTLFVKNPNLFINISQWKRARKFFAEIYGEKYERKAEYFGPVKDLKKAKGKHRKWLTNLIRVWQKGEWVEERDNVTFADGKQIVLGKTTLKFTEPLYHGAEFERIGWVIALTVERENVKFLYTSDIQGPCVDDYAKWIINENPDVLVLDGPPTYLMGYMVKVEQIKRSFENLKKILGNTTVSLVIYDHHLLRESGFREKAGEIYEKYRNKVMTAAEFLGMTPLIERLSK